MKYERLTAYSKINNDYITPYCDKFICDGCCRECDYEQVIINRLAELEDKIENGTLVELPCKVGDEIWWLYNQEDIIKDSCKSIAFRTDNNEMRWFINGTILDGTIMFLTKAEAEKRLEELRGER